MNSLLFMFHRDAQKKRFQLDVRLFECGHVDHGQHLVGDPESRRDAAFDIDTDRLMQSFAQAIRRNGGDILTKSRVTALRRDRNWIVEASGSFEARVIVNAAGPWVDQVAALAGIESR